MVNDFIPKPPALLGVLVRLRASIPRRLFAEVGESDAAQAVEKIIAVDWLDRPVIDFGDTLVDSRAPIGVEFGMGIVGLISFALALLDGFEIVLGDEGGGGIAVGVHQGRQGCRSCLGLAGGYCALP